MKLWYQQMYMYRIYNNVVSIIGSGRKKKIQQIIKYNTFIYMTLEWNGWEILFFMNENVKIGISFFFTLNSHHINVVLCTVYDRIRNGRQANKQEESNRNHGGVWMAFDKILRNKLSIFIFLTFKVSDYFRHWPSFDPIL